MDCSFYFEITVTYCVNTVLKIVSKFMVRSYSGPYSVRMRENSDQNNLKYGDFLCSGFAAGITNFKRDSLKVLKESLFRMSRSSLLNWIIEEGKKNFWKTYAWFW